MKRKVHNSRLTFARYVIVEIKKLFTNLVKFNNGLMLTNILQNRLVVKNHLHNFDIMEALKIEILNPKALQLIKGMQDLNLIKVTTEPVSKIQSYLKKMRKNATSAPSLDEITKIVEEVRTERYAKE